MNNKKTLVWFVIFTFFVMLLSSCGSSAPPETRAGTWKAKSDHGEFTFMVNSSGTGISGIAVDYELTPECSSAMLSGSVRFLENFSFSPYWPIEGNKFSFEGPPKIEGKFSRDGTSASGTWETGSCVSKWEATK